MPVNGVIQNVTALFVFEAEWRIYVLVTWCIIGSDTGLSHVGSQVMIWTTVSTLLIGRVSGIWVKMQQFSSTKMHLKIPPGKWQFMRVLIHWCTCLYTWLRVSCEWRFYFYLVLSFISTLQGLFSQSVKTSHRQISSRSRAIGCYWIIIVSPWYFTCISTALLPMCLPNFRAIEKVETRISGLQDLARFCGKTCARLGNKGPGLLHWYCDNHSHWDNLSRPANSRGQTRVTWPFV